MYGGSRLPKADKFLKKRRKLKLWHRLLLMAGSVVVFITTYMLILPAITAEVGTLAIYDEALSSGGAVIEDAEISTDEIITEETTEKEEKSTEATSEETTESDDEQGAGGSGSGGCGGSVLADGTVVNITLEKVETADNAEKNTLFGNVLSLAAGDDDSSMPTINFYGSQSDGSYVATYDPETGDFSVTLNIDFILSQDLLTEYGGTSIGDSEYNKYYTIKLPAGVIIPEDMVYDIEANQGPIYYGYRTGTTEIVFHYSFIATYDEEGNLVTDEYGNTVYTVVMVFSEEFLESLNGADINGTMSINAYLSSDYYTEDGSIVITDDKLEFELEITYDKIVYDENETVNYDVTVIKDGSYNSTDNTITYTVKVLTKKGTSDPITITDAFSNSDFLTSLGGELVSVEYKQGTVGGYLNQWDGQLYVSDSYTTFSDIAELTEGTDYSYKDGSLIITLPGLDASEDEKYTDYDWMSDYTAYNAYYVTYTYSISPEADTTYTGENTASVEIYDSQAQVTIEDSDTAKVAVTGKETITKTGAYNSDEGIITWMIIVGDGENSVNGYVLYDDMFADLASADDLVITDISGSVISSEYYEILYDEDDTTIIGVKFICEDEVFQYVITYETKISQQWKYQNITNEAELEPPGDEGNLSATETVYIGGLSDCFTKTFSAAEKEDDGTYTLRWDTAFTIPASGISAGITFTDYVNGTGHYITGAQAAAIIEALKEAWGEDYITDIQFYTGTDRWNMSDSLWVEASNINAADTETVYYQFRYTIAQDIAYDEDGNNNISYTYETTANVEMTGNSDNTIYYNTVYDSEVGTSKSAMWTYYKEVVKYGNNNSGSITSSDDTELTVTDGVVSWTVRVILWPGKTYTIEDYLPDGVTLTEIDVITNNINPSYQLALTEGTKIELTDNVSGSVYVTYEGATDNIVTLTAESDATNRNLLYIRFVCRIDGDEESSEISDSEDDVVSAGSSSTTYELKNSVNVVTSDGEEYGYDDQTTTVTWQDEDAAAEILTKDAQFSIDNNIISYSLDINSNAVTYVTSSGETYSDIVITDILEYYSYPSSGIARDASLILSSVSLYYAATDENGNIIYSDGKLVKGSKLTSSDYTWTYETNVVSNGGYSEDVTKKITLTVPNGTALIFEYDFLVTIITDDDYSWGDYSASVSNTAIMTVGGETISSTPTVTTKDEVNESGTSASAHGAAGYTIYKVDENNFSLPLQDAVFDLYVWTSAQTDEEGNVTEEGFKYIDSFTTSSTGYTGITGILKEDSGGSKYYTITLSDGSTYDIPTDTMCYFVESSAPEGYKTDRTTKYYFYYGSSVATMYTSVEGYSSDINQAYNLITSHTQYITNAHSWDYFAEKTSISVIKRWVDSTGNEITKSDGSIPFKLYRVFTDVDGVQTYGPDYSGTDQTDTGSTVKLNWTAYSNSTGAVDSGSVTCDKNSTVTFNISFAGWYPYVLIRDTSGNVLAYAPGQYNDYSGMSSSDATATWKSDRSGGYTVSLDIDIEESKKDILIYFGASESEINSSATISIDGTVEETTAEETTEVTTESEEETESTTTAFYYHVFDDDYLEITDTEISHIYGDHVIYKGSSDESAFDANYFTINGSLTQSHGTTYWDLDGDGSVSESELLDTCLKMETNYDGNGTATNISFTANEGGMLTLVFNAAGNGNETSTITNGVYIDGVLYTATNNVISAYLEAGEHTISRSSYCFLFYMSFEEGATLNSTITSKYVHNFDSGIGSTFYTIVGSTANNKGTVSYDNLDISTCLKMNSKASIAFDTEEAGTLYMIFTNPNGAAVVGATIDGETHYATATGEYDSEGNEIYELTMRISEGEHTITRINSTEVMLYYVEYVPDDFGSGEPVYEEPYNEYAEYVGTYEISSSNSWSWSNTNLLWQVLDDDGNLLGHYSYYVVEVDEEGNYITYYINNSSDGIQSGSIAIYNQDKSDSSTAITVAKKWINPDGLALSDDEIESSIAFNLFARVTIYDDYTDSYDGGTDYSRYFTSSSKLTSDSDGFFTVSGTVQASSSVGELTFTPETADKSITSRYYLKFDGSGKVSFTSPATSGILTLTTYNWSSTGLSSGIGYTLTSPSGTQYKFIYSSDSDNGLTGSYPGTLSNAVEILAGDDTGVTITATSSSTSPSGDGIITFTIFTDEAGEWTVTRNGAQEYLLYMDFSYQYQYLIEGEGVYINNYTMTSDEGWTKTIAGLPYLIYDDDGVTEIGYYSYYIEETLPYEGYITTYEYIAGDDGKVLNDGTITDGQIVITNQKAVSVELPETGGRGTIIYTMGGILLLCFAACLLYIIKIYKGEIY